MSSSMKKSSPQTDWDNSHPNQSDQVAEDPNQEEDIKTYINLFREEHSVEIRESKRKKILQKNRVLGYQNINQEKVICDFQDLQSIQISTNEEYNSFRSKYILYDRDDSQEQEKNQNVEVLISAITSNCSPEFFVFATSELYMYFQDEDLRTDISMHEIYGFIDIILQSQFLNKAKNILNDWRTALNQEYQANQQTYFSNMLNQKPQLMRNYIIGCLQILYGISRGSEIHCSVFEQQNFLQLFFDIFDGNKTQRDITEIIIYIIGSIAATKITWKLFYMQKNFHNTIFGYLKFAPKNSENLILHRRICWCLSNFTRDINIQPDKMNKENLIGQTEFQDYTTFDYSHIQYLCETFIQYDDIELRVDISWAYSQLITLFFSDIKYHPQLINHIIKKNGADVLNIEGNPQLLQIQKQLITDKIKFLMQNGICEYVNAVFPIADMSIIVPNLRMIVKIMGANTEVLEIFFSKCNETILQSISRHLQNHVQLTRRESIKAVHHLFLSEFDQLKDVWFMKFMPIILNRFSTDQYQIKEEVLKLLNSIIDKLNFEKFDMITFGNNNKYCIFKAMRNSLQNIETKPEGLILMLSIFNKILNYYKLGNSNSENTKVKRIIHLIDQNNIAQQIEGLQENPSQGIYNFSLQFIEEYNQISQIIHQDEQNEQNTHHYEQQPYVQTFSRNNPQQSKYGNSDIDKAHEEQKI